MNSKVKEFIKENFIWVALLLFVIFGLGGAKIYNAINDKRLEVAYNNMEKEDLEVYYDNQQYAANEYRVISKTNQDLAEYYYNKVKKMWLEDPGKIWDLMTTDGRKGYNDREDFINRINKYKTSKTANSYVEYYRAGSNRIVILTNESMEIIINQDGINDYKITLMEKID